MAEKRTKQRKRGGDDPSKLGFRLKRVMETHPDPDTGKKMTQAKLAEKLEIKAGEKFISMVINDDRGLSRKNIEKIAALFNVRREYLLLMDDFMTEDDKRREENAAIKARYMPLELVEMLLAYNHYKIDEQSDDGIVLISPNGDKRILSKEEYMKLLWSVNDSLKERLSLIFTGKEG